METGSLGRRGLGGRKYLMEVNMTEEAEQLWPDCNDLHHKCESEGRQDWDSKKRKKVGISLCKSKVAKSLQSCPTLCDPRDGSPPGSPTPGILQARTLEWIAISFSNTWKWKVKVKSLSRVWLLATPGTAAYQATLSMGFSRQEYWSGVPLPSPEDISSLAYSIVFLYFFALFI